MRSIILLTSCYLLISSLAYSQSISIQAKPQQTVTTTLLTESKLILRERLRNFGIKNAHITALPDGFTIHLPHVQAEHAQLIDVLLCICKLHIHVLKETSQDKNAEELTLEDLGPVAFGNEIISEARADVDNFGSAAVYFDITPEYQDALEQFSEKNIGNVITISIDDAIVTVASLQGVIRDTAQISGLDSLAQAENIASALNSGALPLAFELSRSDD